MRSLLWFLLPSVITGAVIGVASVKDRGILEQWKIDEPKHKSSRVELPPPKGISHTSPKSTSLPGPKSTSSKKEGAKSPNALDDCDIKSCRPKATKGNNAIDRRRSVVTEQQSVQEKEAPAVKEKQALSRIESSADQPPPPRGSQPTSSPQASPLPRAKGTHGPKEAATPRTMGGKQPAAQGDCDIKSCITAGPKQPSTQLPKAQGNPHAPASGSGDRGQGSNGGGTRGQGPSSSGGSRGSGGYQSGSCDSKSSREQARDPACARSYCEDTVPETIEGDEMYLADGTKEEEMALADVMKEDEMDLGSQFFYEKSGKRFFIKGIEYQDDRLSLANSLAYTDTLDDAPQCARDVEYLKKLGINSIIVQWLRPEADHSPCMQQLQEAGIYVLAGLMRPNEQIYHTHTWDRDMYSRYAAVVDNLKGFTNLLGFFITGSPATLPYVKAAIRDLKQHLKDSPRGRVPIGYLTKNYGAEFYQNLVCGEPKASIDFLALNINTVCEGTSEREQSIQDVVRQNADYPVPMFAYGANCNARNKTNIELMHALATPEGKKGMSGGFLFEYFDDNRDNITGLVEISGNTVKLRPEFTSLTNDILIKANQTSDEPSMGEYSPPKFSRSACATTIPIPTRTTVAGVLKTIETIQFATNLPPTPDQRLCRCLMRSLECSAAHSFNRGYEYKPDSSVRKDITNPEERHIVQSVCPQNATWCLGAQGDTLKGEYGTFSGCNSTERGSWIINQQYKAKHDAEVCQASKGLVRTPQHLPDDCKDLLEMAGPLGIGAITASPRPRYPTENGSAGLTMGAKIGIAVGVMSLVLMIIGGCIFWLHGRKRAAAAAGPLEKGDETSNSTIVEMPDSNSGFWEKGKAMAYEKVEIEGSPITELQSPIPELESDSPIEMPTDYNERVELDGFERKPPGYSFKSGEKM
ncbi:hypothetical protein BT63DRAFT_483109 [Microthyrium microscopicum]|uniref:1,3-beta-glucanosyltransferase n=1 Tax=Microthyrium microscopicum TaxID=703497 RepID=A0A6A6U2R4_9PEZI|nr:hypothetical protein BT63DRAFT_483109 [Microthyrium microscopicum]